jgi:hypothetical protein
MSLPGPYDRFIEADSHGKFGVAYRFGERRYGKFQYGREEPLLYIGNLDFPDTWHGKDITPVSRFGIYRRFTQGPIRRVVKNRYYIPANPRTVPQQARRTVYADGIIAWQGLTLPEKLSYNARAKGKTMSGYNLFMREYLNSN